MTKLSQAQPLFVRYVDSKLIECIKISKYVQVPTYRNIVRLNVT